MTQGRNGPTIALLPEQIEIPAGIDDLDDFRAWSSSVSFPATGRIDWIDGRIEVDMTPEELYSHGSPKTAIVTALSQEFYVPRKGLVFTDSARISSSAANLSAEPDVVVVLESTLASGAARLVQKSVSTPERFVEIEGAVDLVVECVSDSSVTKDSKRLRELYHRAGIPEYWLVDARGELVDFQILLAGTDDYSLSSPDGDGFARSALLAADIRLVRSKTDAGLVFFALERR